MPDYICDGCNVNHPWEHRCHRDGCVCEQCKPISDAQAAALAINTRLDNQGNWLYTTALAELRERFPDLDPNEATAIQIWARNETRQSTP